MGPLLIVALFVFHANVLATAITGSFMRQAMLSTTSPQIGRYRSLQVFAFILICIDLFMVTVTLKVGVFVIAVFSADPKDIVMNSLALGFITDLDEGLNKHIVNMFPDEATVPVDFAPATNPRHLYDWLGKRGLAGKLR